VREQGEIFHPAGGIFEILSSKDLFRSQEWQAKFILLKVCGYHPPFPIADLSLPKTSSGLEIVAVREIISNSAPSSGASFFQWFASHLWSSSQLSFCSSGV
jgi:hypothetical protein